MKTAIVNYEAGNLFSVFHACKNVGLNPLIADDGQTLDDADIVILPGVGAYGSAMNVLQERGFDEDIIRNVEKGKPLIGICLGMQLMLSESEELGVNKGFGFISGRVKSFRNVLDSAVRVPHVGWNNVTLTPQGSESLFSHTIDSDYMYFVHSFYAQPDKSEHSLAHTSYEDFQFSSIIGKDNLLGIQFHPERSGDKGLNIFRTIKNTFS